MLSPYLDPHLIEAGCDEAGRGCLAGPVFAAAVILPKDFRHPLLNDSKQLTEQQRLELRCIIKASATCWAVAQVDPAEIDQVNILNASFLAMHRALDKLETPPELILVDGNRFTPYRNIAHRCIIKGDGIYMSIAAASILAKTYRDDYMADLAESHPQYGWSKNKGYPTKAHREALRHHGVTSHHRRSFRLLPEQLSLSL
ncbi:ribonuclease HII [Haliscomenobacter hydrossis]|uniref:Ribonuclease HII n=1 Tax=Haliscomenobacter hydrossis (strain ATCC 27775 / DSM 1100 / LMG 10767 / O) TaxID=760192 RepID=F4KPK4_HALH1|nr:ribonuclease HII [Haliscomenobacter hydrossis]AEE50942.1 Ribonuclease H [Haliscomenobacter hydrossis DSM 1100]